MSLNEEDVHTSLDYALSNDYFEICFEWPPEDVAYDMWMTICGYDEYPIDDIIPHVVTWRQKQTERARIISCLKAAGNLPISRVLQPDYYNGPTA